MKILCVLTLCFLIACSGPGSSKRSANNQLKGDTASSGSLEDIPIEKNDQLITIKLPQEIGPSTVFNTSDLVDSLQYIPLETTKESLINDIEQSVIFRDRVFILDNIGNSVLLFNKRGKFIKRVGSKGKGLQEYLNPINLTINQDKEELYVLDDKMHKVLIFDLDGKYKNEHRITFRMNDFQILDDTTYVLNTDVRPNSLPEISNNKLILTNNKWEVFAKGLKYDAVNEGGIAFSRNGLYRYKHQIHYNPTLSYYIYNVTRSALIPKYFIDAGKMALPEGFNHRLDFESFFREYDNARSKYVYIDKEISETDNFLVTTIRYQGRPLYFYYSKKTKNLFCSLYYQSNPDEFTLLTPIRGVSAPEEFYGFMPAQIFKEAKDRFLKANKGFRMTPLLDAVAQDDNPVIAFYKFKEF